jgi:class 3 adenylate cyclase
MIEQKIKIMRFFRNIRISLISCFVSLVIHFLAEYLSSGITTTLLKILPVTFCTGLFVPFVLLSLNTWLHHNKAFKSLPFVIQMLLGIILFIIIITMVFSLSILVFTRNIQILCDNLPGAFIIGTIVATGLFIISTLREFLGKGFWSNLIKGFYQQVRTEKAVILFVDLKNSTKMGETLTPGAFFRLLNDFLRIVEMCCTFFKGDIYKYMGDGAILVWDVSPPGLTGVLNFVSQFAQEMREKAGYFRETYGMDIAYTAGVHSGNVLKGGLGSEKRELGLWGDTINTTARIQSACKQYNVSFLLSEYFVQYLKQIIPETYAHLSLKSVGETVLRGKSGSHELFTIENQA